jgi:hypothetical protein
LPDVAALKSLFVRRSLRGAKRLFVDLAPQRFTVLLVPVRVTNDRHAKYAII